MTSIVEMRNTTELAEHIGDWHNLLAVTPHASFFQSVEWLAARWNHAADEEELFVIATKDGHNTTGFVPLCIQPTATTCGTMRALRFPIDGWGSFYGPISNQPEETLAAALKHVWRSNRKIDLVELTTMPDYTTNTTPNHVDVEAPTSTIDFLGQTCEEATRVAMLDLAGDWDSYWESRRVQKNRRRNVERCERRLGELGTIRYERYRPQGIEHNDADLRWELYDACEAIARASWQDGLTDGNTMHHDHVRPLLRDAHVAAVNAGAADVNVLFLDDRAVAFVYGYHFQGYVDLMRIGFMPDLAKLAPGNALWTRLIQDSFERGDRVLDFGPTCLDYKRFWTNRLEPTYAVNQYAATPKAQALRLARWAKSQCHTTSNDSNQLSKELAQKKPQPEQTDTTDNPTFASKA